MVLAKNYFRYLFSALILAGLLAVGSASADELVSLGTSRAGGPTYKLGLAIAKVAQMGTEVEIRVKPFKSTSQVLSLVDNGEISLGVTNAFEMIQATRGEGRFAGHDMKNLRLIATLYPFKMAFAARKDSGLSNASELKGRR